jgi:hypothetical protein
MGPRRNCRDRARTAGWRRGTVVLISSIGRLSWYGGMRRRGRDRGGRGERREMQRKKDRRGRGRGEGEARRDMCWSAYIVPSCLCCALMLVLCPHACIVPSRSRACLRPRACVHLSFLTRRPCVRTSRFSTARSFQPRCCAHSNTLAASGAPRLWVANRMIARYSSATCPGVCLRVMFVASFGAAVCGRG